MKLYIANKNYSSWSMRPWVMLKQAGIPFEEVMLLSLIHISEPTRQAEISYAVFCLCCATPVSYTHLTLPTIYSV